MVMMIIINYNDDDDNVDDDNDDYNGDDNGDDDDDNGDDVNSKKNNDDDDDDGDVDVADDRVDGDAVDDDDDVNDDDDEVSHDAKNSYFYHVFSTYEDGRRQARAIVTVRKYRTYCYLLLLVFIQCLWISTGKHWRSIVMHNLNGHRHANYLGGFGLKAVHC